MAQTVPIPKPATRICVQKFNDLDGDGKRGPGEPTLTGFFFNVSDMSGNKVGRIKAGECLDVRPGTYMVAEQAQPGWMVTTPNPQEVTVASQQTVTVVFGNRLQAEKKCCQFALMLFNTLPNTIKKVVVIPVNPQAVIDVFSDDPDELTVSLSGNQSVIEPVASSINPGGFYPDDAATMLDFCDIGIRVDPALSPAAVTVRWLNAAGQVLKEELLKLECREKLDPDAEGDWPDDRVTITGVGDDVLFSGAVQEDCEEPERETTGVCDFTATPLCIANQNYLQLMASPALLDKTYEWRVDDNGPHQYSGPGPFNHSLTEGPHSISVDLTVTYLNGPLIDGHPQTEECTKQIDICIPTADFSVGIPSPVCVDGVLNGYKVDFTPHDQDCNYNGSSSISAAYLNFGDGPQITIGPTLPVQNHSYSPTATGINAVLTVTDQWGCTHTKTHPVTIATTCQPLFKLSYELCQTTGTADVAVKFTNESQVFCNPKFNWDFGDAAHSTNTNPVNPNVVTTTGASAIDPQVHTYKYDGSLPPVNYKVILTMTDGPCMGTSAVHFDVKFFLKPVVLDIQVAICPSGQTFFTAQTSGKLIWDVSGPGFLSFSWLLCKAKILAVNAVNSVFKQHNGFNCYLPDGTYVVNAEAEDTSQDYVTATCKKKKEFTVSRTCCREVKAKGHRDTPHGVKNYRMRYKYKIADTPSGLNMRIVGRTKAKIKKTVKHTNLFYWKAKLADVVSVYTDNNLRGGGEHPLDPNVLCKTCITPWQTTPHEENYNKSKAKFTSITGPYGIDKADALTSLHRVKFDGLDWTIKVAKLPGQDCNQWTISEVFV